ncbi:uncharacterized protein LOC136076945 [Hydra vulgaris]|uniref:Uncharacterized protein LOC136076945 n=1 Tax=Hydra vulgaris TaxID=6087 RepID=A0ABM4BDI0_HYDVU
MEDSTMFQPSTSGTPKISGFPLFNPLSSEDDTDDDKNYEPDENNYSSSDSDMYEGRRNNRVSLLLNSNEDRVGSESCDQECADLREEVLDRFEDVSVRRVEVSDLHEDHRVKGKKRVRKPEQWQNEIRKRKRTSGEQYVTKDGRVKNLG